MRLNKDEHTYSNPGTYSGLLSRSDPRRKVGQSPRRNVDEKLYNFQTASSDIDLLLVIPRLESKMCC